MTLSYCGEMVRKHDPDRFLLSLFMKPDRREALWALYAFNHEIARTREVVTETKIEDVHIVGGGARNALLNQLTADRSGRRVLAGPEEATVLGNLLVQARTLGDLPPGVSLREAARRSASITEYTPRNAAPLSGAASFVH